MWYDRTLNLAVVELHPINALEPLVLLDTLSTTSDISQALGGVDGAEARNEVACSGRHGRGKADAALYDPERKLAVASWDLGLETYCS